jgi:hypothetical protein
MAQNSLPCKCLFSSCFACILIISPVRWIVWLRSHCPFLVSCALQLPGHTSSCCLLDILPLLDLLFLFLLDLKKDFYSSQVFMLHVLKQSFDHLNNGSIDSPVLCVLRRLFLHPSELTRTLCATPHLICICGTAPNMYSQLFNPRKHDPVSFSTAQARKPAQKSSGDYTSVSSVSSYAHLVVPSIFILSSGMTDGSSGPSSIFDHNKPRDEPKANAFSNQPKNLYHDISHLETKLLTNSGEPQVENHIVIKGGPSAGADEAEKER